MGLSILVLGYCEEDMLSAQLVFNEDRTLRSVECAHTFRKAVEFLTEHAGALIFCEERPDDRGWRDLLSRLILKGSPTALITSRQGDAGGISVQVFVYGDHQLLRDLFVNGDVIRAVALARQYCKELSRDVRSMHPTPEGQIM